jgi:roadblock/LC7 domain-containing protein
MLDGIRVTRFGEFSPNGRLFNYFGHFLKIAEVAQINFAQINFDENVLGYILAVFLYGHLAGNTAS